VMTLVPFDTKKMLVAGILPGLVLCGLFSLYAIYRAVRDKVKTHPFDGGLAFKTLLKAAPELLIPIVMIALLANGFQVPEAAAITTLYVLVLEVFIFRDVRMGRLPQTIREAMKLVGAIFILIVAATALTDYLVTAKVPDTLNEWITTHIESKIIFLLALNGMLLAVGFVMDIFSALVVVVPLIVPTAAAYGIDPYHLGVIFLLNLEVGFVHPPVGLNLFISAYRFNKPMSELYWAVLPFLAVMLVSLGIVTYMPSLTVVKTQATTPQQAAPVDAGVGAVVQITLSDGGVITEAHCEKPEIKDDALAYAECQNMFKLYPKCADLPEALDRLECQQAVIEGRNPFEENPEDEEAAEPDAGQ
jgi:C4-dicarboxylate transporter DctM subunit